jgi:hypothetical protein
MRTAGGKREMKKLHHIVEVLAIAVTLTGCASTKAYFVDRGRDAADVVTVTVGAGLGAKARIGPLHAGILASFDAMGIRGGHIGGYDTFRTIGWDTTLSCVDAFYCDTTTKQRNKDYTAETYLSAESGKSKFMPDPHGGVPFICVPKCNAGVKPPQSCPYYYTQIEAVLAVGPSVRVGFNPGELLDFFLGWFGIDIMNDDIGTKTPKQESNKVSEDTAHPK